MKQTVWTLVGGSSLAARELREVFEERKLGITLRLVSGEETSAVLTQEGDEAAVIEPLSAEALASSPVVFLAGAGEQNRQALELAATLERPPVAIDLTGSLEDVPGARLRAPMVEDQPTGRAVEAARHRTPGGGGAGPVSAATASLSRPRAGCGDRLRAGQRSWPGRY
jgi:hypothetical protein